MITGEHYVIDLIAGMLVAAAVHLAWNRFERHGSVARPGSARSDQSPLHDDRSPIAIRGESIAD